MKFGVWTPLPHTIRPEPGMDRAIAAIKTGASLAGRADGTFEFACDVVRRADELGFDTTLIAERFLGPDLSAWVLASALAMVTKRIELMVAVHPGMVTPHVVAKMASSLDRISQGRCAQHRQRLVDGRVRPLQQRHVDRQSDLAGRAGDRYRNGYRRQPER